MIVLAIGNPFEGLRLIGPFDEVDSAMDWAERFARNETWMVVPMDDPTKED